MLDLILGLPVELVCEIAGRWLCLKDLALLDSAFCNASKRKQLHASVFDSPLCVSNNLAVGCRSAPALPNRIMKWMLSRKIRVEVLHWTLMSRIDLWKEYLGLSGQHVKCIHFEYVYSQTPETAFQVLRRCPNLNSVVCSGCFFSAQVLDLLSSCEHLRSLEVSNVSFVGDAPKLAETTRRIHVQYINMECDEFTQVQVLRMCAPDAVQRLRLSCLLSANWPQYTNLRTLWFACAETDCKHLIDVLGQCPWVEHLHLPNAVYLTDDLMYKIVNTLHHIHSLNIQLASGKVTDIAIQVLVMRHKSTLKLLYLQGCIGISSACINAVLALCTQLQTISFAHTDGIDYSILLNLTSLHITEFSVDSGAFAMILEHCNKLQYLHIEVPWGSASLDLTPLTTLPYPLPMLRTVCFLNISTTQYDQTSADLYDKRPTVRLLKELHITSYREFQPAS